MLIDPVAIEIISKAQQKNVRDPNRNRVPFENILKDFFGLINVENQTIIDLGPGQFDFGVLLKEKGSNVQIIGVDKDPAVIKLGEHLGFTSLNLDFQDLSINNKVLDIEVDGLFCKFSFNAFWNQNAKEVSEMLENHYLRPLKDNGWAWLAPWNGLTGNDVDPLKEKSTLLELQKNVFRQAGFNCFNLSKHFAIKYGVHGTVQNNPLFIRGLQIPSDLEEFREF